MYQIIIRPGTGFDFNNIPVDVLAISSRVRMSGVDVVIEMNDGNACDMIKGLLGEFGNANRFPASSFRFVDNGYVMHPAIAQAERLAVGGGLARAGVELRQEAHEAIPRVDIRNVRPAPIRQERGADFFANLTEDIAEATRAERPVQEGLREVLEAPEQNQAQDQADDPDALDDGMQPVEGYHITDPVKPENVALVLTKMLRNKLSSDANLLTSKITELNKIMARSIILQNEINLLMKPVLENEKVQSVMQQIEKLNGSGGLIKRAYLSEHGDMIVLTNRIVTEKIKYDYEDGSDFKVFDVGEMEIAISMHMLLCESDPGATSGRPIKIKNLTHEYIDGRTHWQCGHTMDREICFGRVFAQIHQALVARNLEQAVDLIIRFIRNPDPEDAWGCRILEFPVIPAQETVAA
jgi:hypothetical protein